ncbi:MAG: ArsR family transcriptional regulator [Cohnella sp.]|nr:ArsR family transcriptional regulator [Cohnella sp.]
MARSEEILPAYRLETAEQALALLNPNRADLLRLLDVPASATEVARRIGDTPQKVNYHLKSLEKVGLVRRSGTRQVKNLVEVLYQAVARTYVIPDAFGWPEELRTRMKSQGALRHLLSAADQIRNDAARLMDAADEAAEVPSAAMDFEVDLPDEAARQAFIRDYTEAVRQVAGRFRAPQQSKEHAFRVMAVIYPKLDAGGMNHEG